MTLLKSFDKSFKTMISNKIKLGMFFPIIGALVLIIVAVVSPFSEVVYLNNTTMYNYYDSNIDIENVKYILFDSLSAQHNMPGVIILVYFALIVASILCAITVFQQLSSKRTANIYYSLGFSRTKLFASTYISGALCVLGMVVIPMFLSFIVNAFAFGLSKELFSAVIFSTSVLSNVSLIAYTIASIAMVMSGMLFEGAFFAFFLNGITSIFAFATTYFSNALLTGSTISSFDRGQYTYLGDAIDNVFFGKISVLNNLSHSVTEINRIRCCLDTNKLDGLSQYYSADSWVNPNWVPTICWTVVLAGLIAVAIYAFNKKKPENIGFFASNKVLYRIFFGACIFGFTSLACSNGKHNIKGLSWLYIFIVLAVMLAICFVINFIIAKIAKFKMKGERKYYAIYSGAVILIALIFSSGFFGYVNRIPNPEKVASVSVSSIVSEWQFANEYSDEVYCATDEYDGSTPILMNIFPYDQSYDFNKLADITNVSEFHKDLIEADKAKLSAEFKQTRIGSSFKISYKLKNGKEINREYTSLTPELIEKYISFKSVGENIKQAYKNNATYFLEDGTEKYSVPKYYTVFSNDLTNVNNVDLSLSDRQKLVAAYTADIEKMSAINLLKPQARVLGIITMRENINRYKYNDYEGTETFLGTDKEINYENYNSHLGPIYSLFITEDMENTIKWAKDMGIYKHFENKKDMDFTHLQVTHSNSNGFKKVLTKLNDYNLIYSAKSGVLNNNESLYGWDTFDGILTGSHGVELTKSEIDYIRDNAYPQYLITEPGFFLQMNSEKDGRTYVSFIPDSKLTAELRLKLMYIPDVDDEAYTEEITQPIVMEETTQVDA